MKHTALPFEIRGQDIYDANGMYVATWGGTKANAELMVKGSNCHEELVEALHLAPKIAGTLMNELAGQEASNWSIINNGLVKINKAISKATK